MILVVPITKSLFFFSFLYYVCLLSSDAEPALDILNHGRGRGFSVELIHRDSPKSPLYNPSETPSQRLANAIHRSMGRVATRFSSQLSSSAGSAQSTLLPVDGEYLMTLSIGTPPFQILAIADTGSHLTWTQCKPCTQCYNQTAPLFDPKASKTYKNLPCASTLCESASGGCSSKDSSCQYSISYGDESFSEGDLATDTVTLSSTSGSPVLFPNITIGCGHRNGGTFSKEDSGIVGLGRGSSSLVSQMGSSIGGKFSYCLVPALINPNSETNNSSKLNFGSEAVVSGDGVVSTPLFLGEMNTFYYLTLEGVSVVGTNNNNNSRYIKFKTGRESAISSDVMEGNIIIDSGTTLTVVSEVFYSDLEPAVDKEMTKLNHLKRVGDPSGFLSLCYASEESKSSDLQYPIITMHFKGGADVKLNGVNTFARVSKDVLCFSIVPSGGVSIYGNLAQMNFLVGYDTQNKTVSFKPTDCTKYNN